MSCGTKEGDIHLFTPVKAIRQKCLDCAGSPKEVRLCGTSNCPLHPYRLGRHPGRSGIGGNPALLHKNP
jgi:hypothetical protein